MQNMSKIFVFNAINGKIIRWYKKQAIQHLLKKFLTLDISKHWLILRPSPHSFLYLIIFSLTAWYSFRNRRNFQ